MYKHFLMKHIFLPLFVFLLLCVPQTGHAEGQFFPFVVSYDAPENATSMAKYLDAPAGKHGFIRCDRELFKHNDGEIRFWGTNLSGAANFPTHEMSERIAARLARVLEADGLRNAFIKDRLNTFS